MKSVFSQRLAARRKELKMTQEDLATACGLTSPAISNFESDKRKPNYLSLLKIARILNVSTDFLLGVKERDYQDLLRDSDSRIREMMEGMMTLSEKHKDMLFRVYQFLEIRREK